VAKSGINAIVRHVASRWGRDEIRANAVAPGLRDWVNPRTSPRWSPSCSPPTVPGSTVKSSALMAGRPSVEAIHFEVTGVPTGRGGLAPLGQQNANKGVFEPVGVLVL